MTQREDFVLPDYGRCGLLPNPPRAERMHLYLESVGAPEFTAQENDFALKLQEQNEIPQVGLASNVCLPNR